MDLPDPNLKPVILELTGETVYLPLFGKGFVIWGAGLYDPYYKSIPIKGVEQIPGHQEIRAGSVNPITKLKQSQ